MISLTKTGSSKCVDQISSRREFYHARMWFARLHIYVFKDVLVKVAIHKLKPSQYRYHREREPLTL